MGKNKVVFAYTEESPRSEYLISILKDEFDLLIASSCEEITDILHKSYDSLEALIIDHPSDKDDIGRLFDYVSKRNSFMFTLPIIILTEFSMMEEDDKFLSDLVVGMIVKGETKRTVLQRIRNTIKYSNSASFDDFSYALTHLPSLIYLKDKRGRYAFCSQSWHHLTKPNESVRGLTDFDIRKSKENARIAQENDRKVLESGKGTTYIIKEEDDEGLEYLQVIKEPIKDENNNVTGIIAIINNVTDSELLRQELRKKSITDQLTGVFNRVYFEEIVSGLKDNIEYPLTFISADCDGLKKINDKYGHAAGDKYICFARDAMNDILPENSILFRMGGDEFIALVPNLTNYAAKKLVKEISKNARKYKTPNFALKLSVGSYTITSDHVSIEAAVNLSDKSMYKMKRNNK